MYAIVAYNSDKHSIIAEYDDHEIAKACAKACAKASAFLGVDTCFEIDYTSDGKLIGVMPDGENEVAFYCAHDYKHEF